MKEILKSKRTKIALLSLVAVLVGATGLGTLALLTVRTEPLTNTFEIGNVRTEIEEVFEQTEVATEFKKEPRVVNTGANDCYVRVRVSISPEEQVEIPDDAWDKINWSKQVEEDGDVYYYYVNALKSGEKTTPLFTTVSVKEEYIDTIESFEVTVYQEAVQASMSAADGSSTNDAAVIWAAYESNMIPATFNAE